MTIIKYVIHTKDRGLVLAPKDLWTGYSFKIHGRPDSDYKTNPDDCRGILGGRVFVNNMPICFRGVTQKFVTLSVMEADIAAGIMVAKDMLYMYHLQSHWSLSRTSNDA